MLRHSFIHLSGVGQRTERQLWSAGLDGWDRLGDGPGAAGRFGLSSRRWDKLAGGVQTSVRKLADGDAGWFQRALPAGEAWRLFGDFHEQAAYLDIETDGSYEQRPTTVVLHRQGRTHFFVRDRNLHELPLHLVGVKLLVTYNGRSFDWPVLGRHFARLPGPSAHLDLRYPFARLGFRGGLKAIEHRLGLSRRELEGIDGMAAVWLWSRHESGDSRALPTLLGYNALDVLNLKLLAEWVYNALSEPLPVPAVLFANPRAAACDDLPTPDAGLVAECREAMAAATGAW
ncbi:MAG: hypothetical protein BIFFINMI_02674 [Phycisphaerae bacterium]|nr:hypothetical protein [Phycisphaerae bacterium]